MNDMLLERTPTTEFLISYSV